MIDICYDVYIIRVWSKTGNLRFVSFLPIVKKTNIKY